MDSIPKALVASAAIVAVALVVAAHFLSTRYQIAGTNPVVRLDRLTGAVTACTLNGDDYGAAQEANTAAEVHCDVPAHGSNRSN